MNALGLRPVVAVTAPAAWRADLTTTSVVTRSQQIAGELKTVIRLAARDPEALAGELPALSALSRVSAVGELDEAARVHLILHRLIPEYLQRLPAGRDCRAIRELLTWEDGDGEIQSLTTRYHKAAAHLVSAAHDFGRRQEPRLLAECARRLIALDHEDRLGPPAGGVAAGDARGGAQPELAARTPPALASSWPAEDSRGAVVRVHDKLDYHELVDHMAGAREIALLNTWIPGIDILADALVDALARGASVSILLLDPDSHVARLRSRAPLRSPAQGRFREDRVRPEIRHCLDVLAAVSSMVDDDRRRNLRLRLYDALPSISVYGIDDRAFAGFFLHGQLAVRSTQIEVLGRDSAMGRLVLGELETLWSIGREYADTTRHVREQAIGATG